MAQASRPKGAVSLAWRRLRSRIAGSRVAKRIISRLLYVGLKGVYWSNRSVPGSHSVPDHMRGDNPAIGALWHGQHIMLAAMKPKPVRVAAMVSRSADAELNAMVLELATVETVRGSGGRSGESRPEKGGATALLQLKKVLDDGGWTVMIADVPKGTPREAGPGIITLARMSGKPIVPGAFATSRRRVLEKSWDKTTINLPFGRKAMIFGDPVHVPVDADDDMMESKRRELTEALNDVTRRAYALVDGK